MLGDVEENLAARAVLSRSRVSRIITELEKAALVERQPDSDDGRAWLATLTPAGRDALRLRQTAPLYLAAIDRHFNRHLSTSGERAIARTLQPVLDAHQAEVDLRQ